MASTSVHLSCVRPSVSNRWQTKFARLVRRYGVANLARALQIDPCAVYQWIRGNVSPRPALAIQLVDILSEVGHIRLEDIYAHRSQVPPLEFSRSRLARLNRDVEAIGKKPAQSVAVLC